MLNTCVAQKYMQTYDDSVLKLSIKQGEEHDRFPSETVDINSINYDTTSTLPGSFTSGELAYTRDTNRVFVGNFTNETEFLYEDPTAEVKNLKIQQTLGGTLVGNKYLGYIDSKPAYNNDLKNAKPLSLTEDTTLEIDGATIVEPALLKKGSAFRSYEFEDSSKVCKLTEDGNWSRQSFYNTTYDAYDGDYMYDIYRNALIIFDHNIKPFAAEELPSDNKVKSTRRRSKLTSLETDNKDDSPKTVYEHTLDMYGDGYVCIYNVIPDGDTLTFKEREFSNTTGKPEDGNYTQNIIKVQKVYPSAMIGALDPSAFTLSANKNNITLTTTQRFGEIKLPENNSEITHLILPSNIGLYNNVLIDFAQLPEGASSSNMYELQFQRGAEKDGYNTLAASFVPRRSMPSYTLQLGTGLKAADGSDRVEFNEFNTVGKILISSSNSSSDSAFSLTANPFSLTNTDSSFYFTSNVVYNVDGSIQGENLYPEAYAKNIKNITKQYDNENTKLNYLVESTPIVSNESGSATATFKFKTSPFAYCSKKTPSNTALNAVGIFSDVTLTTPKFNYTKEDGTTISVSKSTQVVTTDMLKNVWVYTQNGTLEAPADYAENSGTSNYVYINHPINATYTKYIANNDTEGVNVISLGDSLKAVISNINNSFNISIKDGDETMITFENVSQIYNALNGVFYGKLEELYYDLMGKEIQTGATEFSISQYNTSQLDTETDLRLEFETLTTPVILNIPTKKYVTKITHTIEKVLVDGEEIDTYIFADALDSKVKNISLLEYYGKEITTSNAKTTFKNYTKSYSGDELKNYLLAAGNEFVIDENILLQNSNKIRIYMVKITDSEGASSTYNLITDNFSLEPAITGSDYLISNTTSETEEYTLFGDSTRTVNLTKKTTQTILEDRKFYLSDEFYLEKYLDCRAFYYGDEDKQYCLGGYMSEEDQEKWEEQRRVDVMRQFPVLPAHVTSVILECVTAASASLVLTQIGNNKDKGYETNTLGGVTATGGISLPTNLKASGWTKDKPLLNMGASSTQYVEVPVSIDENGNKHFTFKVAATGNVVISIAAYRV